jgi:hypothetical protein
MDEKGIQMGGGQKKGNKVYFYLRSQVNWYRIGSDNLELVTIVECVSADGQAMPPSFILQEGPLPDLHHIPNGEIAR